jgi:hypothetical protein
MTLTTGHFSVFVAKLLAAAVIMLAPMPSNAQLLRCASKTITMSDYAALKGTANRAAVPHQLDWRRPSICMNPGRGRAWIDAHAEPQPDGSVIEPSVSCDRDTGRWHCEAGHRRTLKISLAIGGQPQAFDLAIPVGLNVEEVRQFISRVFGDAPALTYREACDATTDRRRTQWEIDAEQELHDAFKPRGGVISGAIMEDANATTFAIDSLEIRYSRKPADVAGRTLSCWTIVVVVT